MHLVASRVVLPPGCFVPPRMCCHARLPCQLPLPRGAYSSTCSSLLRVHDCQRHNLLVRTCSYAAWKGQHLWLPLLRCWLPWRRRIKLPRTFNSRAAARSTAHGSMYLAAGAIPAARGQRDSARRAVAMCVHSIWNTNGMRTSRLPFVPMHVDVQVTHCNRRNSTGCQVCRRCDAGCRHAGYVSTCAHKLDARTSASPRTVHKLSCPPSCLFPSPQARMEIWHVTLTCVASSVWVTPAWWLPVARCLTSSTPWIC